MTSITEIIDDVIYCYSCGEKTTVLNSRPTNSGSIRRRRVCVCGDRFTTYEVRKETYEDIVERTHKLQTDANKVLGAINFLKNC